MKGFKIASALLTLFVTLPIGFYLQWQILKCVDASELMWFLFYAHWPLLVLMSVVSRLSD